MTQFTCPVVAKEMTKDVTAKIILGDGTEGAVYAYSVRDYADYVIANSAGNYSDEAITLVKAMLNYGAYSQKYFGYNTEDLANDGVESDLLNIALDKDYSKAINNADGLPEGMDYYGTSLVLESGTVIRHYFTYSGVMGSEQLFAQYGLIQKGNYYYKQTNPIVAGNYGAPETVEVWYWKIEYGVFSYCQSALASESLSDDLKNVVMKFRDWQKIKI